MRRSGLCSLRGWVIVPSLFGVAITVLLCWLPCLLGLHSGGNGGMWRMQDGGSPPRAWTVALQEDCWSSCWVLMIDAKGSSERYPVIDSARMPGWIALPPVESSAKTIAFGLPLRALKSVDRPGRTTALSLPGLGLVPRDPIWSGLALDTLVWAGMWVVLAAGWRTARRMRPASRPRRNRLRAGKCPECAYDLRSDGLAGCPECGWGTNADAGPHASRAQTHESGAGGTGA